MLPVVLFEHTKSPFYSLSVFRDGIVLKVVKEVGKCIKNEGSDSSKRLMGIPPLPSSFQVASLF